MIRHFSWDPLEDNIVEEFDEDGNTIVDYTTEPDYHGNVISQRRDGVTSTFHHDGLGSTIAVTNDAGDVTDTLAYSAFGGVTHRTGTTEFPFHFVGRNGYYFDEPTNSYMIRRRPYDPTIARWLSVDPLQDGIATLYTYSANDPVNGLDPSGLNFIAIADREVALLGPFGSLGFVYHYSIQLWECEADALRLYKKWVERRLENNDSSFSSTLSINWTPAIAEALCDACSTGEKGRKLESRELLANKWWKVWGRSVYPRSGHISWEIRHIKLSMIQEFDTATRLIPIFNGTAAEVNAKWMIISAKAATYAYAEQRADLDRPSPVLRKWSKSEYVALGNNSNTFVRYLVAEAGLTMIEMDGSHPGNILPDASYAYKSARYLPWKGLPDRPMPRRGSPYP